MQLPQVARVLPGPAGKLQELAAAGALQQATPEAPGLKAGSTSGISPSQAANQYDAAFLSSSWAAAKAFAEEDAVVAGPVRSIKSAKELGMGKVPRMLLLLSSYHPSGAGSAFSKVKDPTGTMGAALHSSALQQQPQLGPGCVLLLQNVSVLTPNPGSCYLAVTADNIVQAWGPDQTGRSIRNVTHQPAATQHPQQQQQQQVPQQQQHVPQQQQQRQQSLHTQQQQQQGPFGKTHPGQQQRPGTAAAAASGADSRQTNPFIPPPSPDIMSVLNQMSGKSAGPPAAAAGPVGPGSHQTHFRPQQQQQQQWQQRQIEQQGQFSPALSGAGIGPSVQHQTQQQQQQQQQQRPCLGSMLPPPPRQPAAGAAATHHTSQQQQHGRSGLASTQQQGQEPVMGQSLFKGWSQPNGMMGTQGRANPAAAAHQHAGATGAAAGGGTNMIGANGASGFGHRAPGLGSGPVGGLGGRATAAAAAVDDDEDVEVDENIVAAIFGSQVPKPVAPILPPQQQQQQGSSVTGAFRGVTGQYTPSAAGSSRLAPRSSWVQQQKTPGSISSGGNQQVRGQGTGPAGVGPSSTPGSAGVSMNGAGPAGSIAGKMGPPAPRPQQQQQKWGMPGDSQQQQQGTQDRPPMSGDVLVSRGAVGGFAGGVLGKRPAAHMSLLDDLVDGLDDF